MNINSNGQVTATIGESCQLVNGRAFKPTEWTSTGLPIIRIQNLNDESKKFNYFDGAYKKQHEVNDGDLLFSWSGTPGTSFGAFFWNRGRGVLNQHIFNVLLDEGCVDKRFFRYVLNSRLDEIISHAHGGVGLQHITKGKLESIKIPLPPLPEQKRIADILDKADAVRRKRREAIELLSNSTSSLFFQEFGDPLFSPKEWDVVPLIDVCHKITDGVHFKPTYTETGVPFVSVKDITTGKLCFDDTKYISEEAHDQYIKRCNPEIDDVLLTKVGATYGRPALVDTDRPFSIYVSVALIKPDRTRINPIFLKEVLASDELKRQADRSIKGAGVPDLHLVEIRKFRIPLPPIGVQEEFVKQTRAIHACEEFYQADAQQLNDLFNCLVQRAFKGEL